MKYVIFTGSQNQRLLIYIDKIVGLSEQSSKTVILANSETIIVKHNFDEVINMIKSA